MATILLVDDERISRTLLRVALERARHRVVEAGSSRRALALAERCPEPIDLLVAELSLPGCHGVDLARSLHARYPAMRALFVSRSLAAAKLEREAQAMGAVVLKQPFDIPTLLAAAEEQLAASGPARKPPAQAGDPELLKKAKSGRG